MPDPLSVVPAALVAAVLIASGIAKFRHPDDLDGWADLGVPSVLRRTWLLRLHPWGELLLGLVLLFFGGLLGEIAAVIALALMIAYLVFVVLVLRTGIDTSCACFGTRKRITVMTAVRNGWYVVLAFGAVGTTWTTPLLGGPLAVLSGSDLAWAVGLAATAITVALTMWPVAGDAADAEPAQPVVHEDGDELDYIRTRTPSVPVTRADGEVVDLRKLSMTDKPLLLLQVRPGCGSCVDVHERIGEIRALLPEVSVRLLLAASPDASEWTELTEPQSLHDPEGYLHRSISDFGTPTAVLFGMDGMLAGGPVLGSYAIFDFIADVYESLHGERPPELL